MERVGKIRLTRWTRSCPTKYSARSLQSLSYHLNSMRKRTSSLSSPSRAFSSAHSRALERAARASVVYSFANGLERSKSALSTTFTTSDGVSDPLTSLALSGKSISGRHSWPLSGGEVGDLSQLTHLSQAKSISVTRSNCDMRTSAHLRPCKLSPTRSVCSLRSKTVSVVGQNNWTP